VLVGAYALGKAQRVITELRRRGHEQPIYYHGALERFAVSTRSSEFARRDATRAGAKKRRWRGTSSLLRRPRSMTAGRGACRTR
jgi:Cft2 family RNA processing exonuclease